MVAVPDRELDPAEALIRGAAMPTLIYQDGRIVIASRSAGQALGMELSQLEGKNYRELVVPQEHPQTERNFERVLREGGPLTNVGRHVRSGDGQVLRVTVASSRVAWRGRWAIEVTFFVQQPSNGALPVCELTKALQKLTARERQIVELLGDGDPTASIVKALGIKDSTYRSHLKSSYRKLGVESRLDLLRLLGRLR